MPSKNPLLSFVAACVVASSSFAQENAASTQPAAPKLRDAAGSHLLIGTAAMSRALDNPRIGALVAEQFNQITPENEMKPVSVHPEPGVWNFDGGDRVVAFAQAHNIAVVGHNLCWHTQSPRWMFEDDHGNPLPRDVALANMKEHITTVLKHYKGKIKGWDVVNEATSDEDGQWLRDTPALRAIGEDFVLKAFEFAHEADPDVELYYNDYDIDLDYKRDKALKLVKKIREAGLRIDAVGIQGHYLINNPTVDEVERGVKAFSDAGFDVHITELDVDVLPRNGRSGADTAKLERTGPDLYRNGLPPEIQQKLADRYADLFRVFTKYPRVKRVTFWGMNDGNSWLNGYPVRGRVNHPLLFDRQYNPKPALGAVYEVMNEAYGAK